LHPAISRGIVWKTFSRAYGPKGEQALSGLHKSTVNSTPFEGGPGVLFGARRWQRKLHRHNAAFPVDERVFFELIEYRTHSSVISQELASESFDATFSCGVDESPKKSGSYAAPLIIVGHNHGWLSDRRLVFQTNKSCDSDPGFSSPRERPNGTNCIVINAV
jgi:hypothetical protein